MLKSLLAKQSVRVSQSTTKSIHRGSGSIQLSSHGIGGPQLYTFHAAFFPQVNLSHNKTGVRVRLDWFMLLQLAFRKQTICRVPATVFIRPFNLTREPNRHRTGSTTQSLPVCETHLLFSTQSHQV